MQRVGNEPGFDAAVVGFLKSNPLRIGRPPEALASVHLFLSNKLGDSVLERFRRAGGDGQVRLRFQIDDVHFAAAYRGHRAPIRGKMRIDPIASRQVGDLRV